MDTYWLSKVPDLDDLGNPIHDEFVDGSLRIRGSSAWGLFTPSAFRALGGSIGLGMGQYYRKQPDGKWLKVAG